MIKPGPVFTHPRTPAARCLHLVRLNPIITRNELVDATGLSQPTITRAIAALLEAGLVQERADLTRTRGRGRPTVPLEIAENNWMLAGISVGTSASYIGLYDTHGRTIREDSIPTPVATLSEEDFIEHVIAGVNRLKTGVKRQLVSMGVTTSGSVDESGLVWASNLGWKGVDIGAKLRYQFGVPVVVSSAISAILGSETQGVLPDSTDSVMVFFADDSIGAALSTPEGVSQINPLPTTTSELLSLLGTPTEEALSTAAILAAINSRLGAPAPVTTLQAAAELAATNAQARTLLDERAHLLGTVAAELANQHNPQTITIAGSAFIDDPHASRIFARALRTGSHPDIKPQLRVIPTHREIVSAIARAVALDPILRLPLQLKPDDSKLVGTYDRPIR
ncbi:MAG: ROK family protein [Corynebacterium sp.]|nr:ROK family protein [Corynebacterium sp.]